MLKLISKVLVNRLRPYLSDLIGPLQSSFIPGRGTSDNAIIAQEMIHYMRKEKKKVGSLMFKIDLEKAYDRVSWPFLKQTLLDFGFPECIIGLIMGCISSSSLALIWNGVKLPPFYPSRGLRQGDPLSPYLFVLCMEKLAILINSKVEDGSWNPIKVSRNGPSISHLFFADDCLLFVKAKSAQVRLVSKVLNDFCAVSGLKVNLAKSIVMASKCVPHLKCDKFSSICQMSFIRNISKYLGFPLLSGRIRKEDFHYVLDSLQKKLSGWKSCLLNRAGRVTLAKSVLSSIPVYPMHIYWMPNNLCDSIDTIVRKFIWQSNNSSTRGLHLVNWDIVTLPKKLGGLGIRKARWCNVALLGKLVWSLLHDDSKLWVQLLKAKYVANDNLFSMSYGPLSSCSWKAIVRALSVLKPGFEHKLGCGNASLWYDHWTSLGPICHHVPYVDI